jgi:uncharacterized protein YbcI
MDQDLLNSISSYTSKILRSYFGKGPQSCQTVMNKNHLVIYICGFISSMEEVLIKQGHRKEVEKARTLIINSALEELKGIIRVSLNAEVSEFFHDWNLPNNSGVIIFVLDESFNPSYPEPSFNQSMLEAEVARISMLVQKAPDTIVIYPVSSTVILVERTGILFTLEKALIEKGFEEELKITMDELEKSYFHRYGKIHEIFDKQVKDIFIDWNLREDRSIMAFILH